MATEVVKVIDPDSGTGYDYDNLYDWEAAQQGDLTGVRDEIAIAKCRCTGGTADTAVTIDGWTTSATQFIKIWTDPSESYRPDFTGWPTGNKYRIERSISGHAITISDNYVRLIGIAVKKTSNANDSAIKLTDGLAGGVRIISCYVYTDTDMADAGIGHTGPSTCDDHLYIINCMIVGLWQQGIYVRGEATTSRSIVYNCTAYGCSVGFQSRGSYCHIKNCLSIGCSDAFNEITAYQVADYNAYDEGTDPGTNGVDLSGYTDAQIFVDAANGDFHLVASSPAIGVGVNLYNDSYYPFQDDIDGDDRGGSGAQWDIGADEYVASGTSAVSATDSVAVTEDISVSIEAAPASDITPNVSDSISITDVATVDNSTVPLAASDACAVSEEIGISLSIEVSIFDEIELVEDITNASDSIISTYDEISISEYTDNLVGACVLDTYDLVTISEYAIVYAEQLGTVVWGHATEVEEVVAKDFQGNWTGTGSIGGSGDEEVLELDTGTYMESESIQLGTGNVVVALNKYRSGTLFPVRKYKTAAAEGDLAGLGWSSYTDQFYCEGWVKIRLEAA